MSREFTRLTGIVGDEVFMKNIVQVVAKNIEKPLTKNMKYFSDVKQEIKQMKEKNDQNCKYTYMCFMCPPHFWLRPLL